MLYSFQKCVVCLLLFLNECWAVNRSERDELYASEGASHPRFETRVLDAVFVDRFEISNVVYCITRAKTMQMHLRSSIHYRSYHWNRFQ